MYGNTERMMEAVARGLADENVCRVRIHNVSRTDPSYVIRDAWRFKGLILGGPTYDTGLHPRMDNLIRLLEGKKLKDRFLGLFGTFGWSGGGVDALTAFAEKGNCELVRPVVEACCAPKAADLDGCAELARNMVAKLRDWRGC
jgi:flavorubredoxin